MVVKKKLVKVIRSSEVAEVKRAVMKKIGNKGSKLGVLPPLPKNERFRKKKKKGISKVGKKFRKNSRKMKVVEKKKIAQITGGVRMEKDIAMDFAGKVQQKFDRLVKASVLFGSQTTAKGGASVDSDIDIIRHRP